MVWALTHIVIYTELFVDCYSRADLPTQAVLRRSRDGTVLLPLEHASVRTFPVSSGSLHYSAYSLYSTDRCCHKFALRMTPT
eukprot:COSAG05_NODE_3208_length_2242_cov_3.339171_3_plen_82_part_00